MPLDNSNTQSFRTHRLKCKAAAATPGPITNEQTTPESSFVDYKLGKMSYIVQPASGGPVTTDAGCCGSSGACTSACSGQTAISNLFPLAFIPGFPQAFGGTVTSPPPPPVGYPLATCTFGNFTGVGIIITVNACSGATYDVTLTDLSTNTIIPNDNYYIGTGDGTQAGGVPNSDFIVVYPTSVITCQSLDTINIQTVLTVTKDGCASTVIVQKAPTP